jgi:hypothetical protein
VPPSPAAIAACFDEIGAESFAEIGGDGAMVAEATNRKIPRAAQALDPQGTGAGQFDVVYASRLPGDAAEVSSLARLAERRLVVDVPLLGWGDMLSGALYRSRDGQRYSEAAIRRIFNGEQAVFEPVRIVRDPAGFATVIADKRRIGHMVVVCAPTSGGKSTIAQRILDDATLRRTLGIEDAQWEVMKAEDFFTRDAGDIDHVIVMYNLLRRLNKEIAPGEDDPLPLIFEEAERLTIVTLVTPPQRLREQFQRSEMPDPNRRYSEKILRLHKAYQRDDFLERWYREWFEYQESLPAGRADTWMIVFTPDGERVTNIAGWRQVIASTFGATA